MLHVRKLRIGLNIKRGSIFKCLVTWILLGLLQGGLQAQQPYVLVVHGGAGNIHPEQMTEAMEGEYKEALLAALEAGETVLQAGGSAVDAVETAVRLMEDAAVFNAGRGAVFTLEGTNELDASIMCGKERNAGAVAGVATLKNPIMAARMMMDRSPHVLLTGKAADQFGFEQGLDVVSPSYFFTQRRWDQYREFLRRQRENRSALDSENVPMGTVGAVALDREGNLAAATSTGGMTGKRPGRIGDSPLIGAGTYASNESCAVSATGHGEYFIRNVVAYDIAARVAYRGADPVQAASDVIHGVLKEHNANGGVIVVDAQGRIAMVFNTSAMFRGYVREEGERVVGIFAD